MKLPEVSHWNKKKKQEENKLTKNVDLRNITIMYVYNGKGRCKDTKTQRIIEGWIDKHCGGKGGERSFSPRVIFCHVKKAKA